MLHLRPVEATVLNFPNSQEENQLALERQMANLLAHVQRKHGPRHALLMFADAAIAVTAAGARVGNCEVAMAYALQVTIERALVPERWRK